MSKKRGFGKFLTGIAIGAGLGVLFAPKSGSETREDLKRMFEDFLEKVKDIKVEDVKKEIEDKIAEIKAELKDLDKEKVLAIAKEKGEKIKAKSEEVFKLAKDKGTPVVEKAAKELKEKTASVVKAVLVKLES